MNLRRLDAVALVLVGCLGIAAAVSVVRARSTQGGTPYWDEASHGLQGFVILQDLLHGDIRGFAGDVFGTHFRYPFGHSVLLVPAYALWGATWLTAVGVSAGLFAAFGVMLFLAARHLAERPAGSAGDPGPSGTGAAPRLAGCLAAGLALTSPVLLQQASTIMLELPASVLGVLVVCLYGRAMDRPDRVGRFAAVGWTLTAFVLTASQYATVWLFVVGVFEAARSRPEDRRDLLGWVKSAASSRAIAHPLHLCALLLFLLAGAVVATGGWAFRLGSHSIRLERPGTPLTLGILVLGVRVAWWVIRDRNRLRTRVPPVYQAYFISLVVPLFAWFFVIYPMRMIHYLNWVARSPATLSRASLEYWILYPRLLLGAGTLSAGVSVVLFAVALLGCLVRGLPEKQRFLRWALLATATIVTLHPARQARFIVPFLPLWILQASVTAAQAWDRLRGPALRWGLGGAAAALVLAGLAPAAKTLYSDRLGPLVAATFTPERMGYRRIVEQVLSEGVKKPSVRILGTFPGLSHHLFEWEFRRKIDLRQRELDFDVTAGTEAEEGPENAPEVFRQWLAEAPEDLVFSLEPIGLGEHLPDPKGTQGEVTQETYRIMVLLEKSDRFSRVQEWVYPEAGLRVVEFARIGDRPYLKKRTKRRSDR